MLFKRIVSALALFATLLFFTTLAFAQATVVTTEAGAIPSWQQQLLLAITSAFALILTAGLPVVIKYITRKYKLESSFISEQQIQTIVENGIQFAEEQAKKGIKSHTNAAGSGSAKLDSATNFVLAQIQERKLPQKSAETIKNLIEARLPVIKGVGAANVGPAAP